MKQVATNTYVLGTRGHNFYVLRDGDQATIVDAGCSREWRKLVAGLELRSTVFRSDHASNYLVLKGTLPRDRERMLAALDGTLADPDAAPFRPEWLRGL